jgi:phage terminase large subunit GpA-like protein
MRERNEALDARVYARAAAWILGADRFDERMWRQLEKQAGVETTTVAASTPEQEKPTAPEAGRITAPRRRGWKISTLRYME